MSIVGIDFPHFHLRRAWPCKDEETGLTTTDQTKALLKAGILPPGFKDVQEWMQKSPWYREFELGREAERKLRMVREWER